MKMFIWFGRNEYTGEVLKIYAVAEDLPAARRQVEKILPASVRAQFDGLAPQSVWSLPFAEVNMFKRGKGQALVAADKVG